MSEARISSQKLENLAKLQQMKLNTRLAALEAATKIVSAPGFMMPIPEHAANSVTVHTTIAIAQELESGLMNVLIDVVPETKRTEEVTSLMNGPVVNPNGRSDVVVNQEQVDDLLDSLGF
mgnify:CR=1 FL=1